MVWPTQADAIAAAIKGGVPPGKVPVAKPGKGGFTYDYESPASGIRVEVDKEGNISLLQGPGAMEGKLGKPAQGKIEEKLLNTTEGLSRLKRIESLYKPEYQELGTKWGIWQKSFKEKLGLKLNPNEKRSIEEITKYKRSAYDALNKFLNDLSGAAISPAEALRLRKQMPDPGDGILEGDGPTEFKAKLDESIQSARYAIARYEYAMKNKMDWKSISLENMPEIMPGLLKKQTDLKSLSNEELLKQLDK